MVTPLSRELLIRASARCDEAHSGTLSARARSFPDSPLKVSTPLRESQTFSAVPTTLSRTIRLRWRWSYALPIIAVMLLLAHTSTKRHKSNIVSSTPQDWHAQLRQTLQPACSPRKSPTRRYDGSSNITTALASNMRSGNSYLRSMIERATGWQTSSIYCDQRLSGHFAAECDGFKTPWLVKTHWPKGSDVSQPLSPDRWEYFDQAVYLTRNPIDMAWSLYHFEKTASHTARVDNLEVLGSEQRDEVLGIARRWLRHYKYWTERGNYRQHVVRYEDLINSPLQALIGVLTFILPPDEMPSLQELLCSTRSEETLDPYKSRKDAPFHAWSRFEPELRAEFLDIVAEPWCRFGYDKMLANVLQLDSPIKCKSYAAYNKHLEMNARGQYLT